MKAILEFNLPQDEVEHQLALNGANYKIALDEMDNYLRNRLKYEELDDKVYEALQLARNTLTELTQDIYTT